MNSVCMVTADLIPYQAAQMRLIEDDDIVEQLSATASNPTFRDSVGPSLQQHLIVTMEIESSESHMPSILSLDAHSSW
jgi:hypothetical protein